MGSTVIVTCAVVAALGVAGVIGAGDPRPRVESARQANERVAARIVDAWLAGDLLTGIEPLHGEWYFTMPAGSPLYTAHVGFTDAIGELRVLSQCAVLP